MPLFRKKKEPEPGDMPEDEPAEEPKEEEPADTGDMSLGQAVAELEKLKAKFSTFYEVNKATTERFTRINEQIGELRTMILERDKSGRMLEAKATQAIDMVQTVQPDKLMVELRKEDAKIEALRANLESNEVVINNAINELKNMRNKMQIFTGMEQVVKLNEEVRKDLVEIKKLGATVERHSDKVETIFSEMQKRFSNFERFSDRVDDIDKSVKDVTSDTDSIKAKATDFSSKRDLENLIVKFNNFERQVSGIITLITKKFDALEQDITEKFKEKLEKIEKMLKGFETLAQKTPDLNKYFDLLEEEAKKAPKEEAKVEKIKVPGEEEMPKGEEKESFAEKLKGLKEKIPKIGAKEAKAK